MKIKLFVQASARRRTRSRTSESMNSVISETDLESPSGEVGQSGSIT